MIETVSGLWDGDGRRKIGPVGRSQQLSVRCVPSDLGSSRIKTQPRYRHLGPRRTGGSWLHGNQVGLRDTGPGQIGGRQHRRCRQTSQQHTASPGGQDPAPPHATTLAVTWRRVLADPRPGGPDYRQRPRWPMWPALPRRIPLTAYPTLRNLLLLVGHTEQSGAVSGENVQGIAEDGLKISGKFLPGRHRCDNSPIFSQSSGMASMFSGRAVCQPLHAPVGPDERNIA